MSALSSCDGCRAIDKLAYPTNELYKLGRDEVIKHSVLVCEREDG